MKVICLLRTRMNWNLLIPISGHRYVEIYSNPEVQILKCQECGNISTGFYFDTDNVMQEILSKSKEQQ